MINESAYRLERYIKLSPRKSASLIEKIKLFTDWSVSFLFEIVNFQKPIIITKNKTKKLQSHIQRVFSLSLLCVCVCVCVCARARARVCVCVCVYVCE